jgi:Fanconi anemia group M protein
LAPTKPLVEQQKKSFEGFFENSGDFNFQVLTGHIQPKKRKELYENADFVFSTPQLIENDIINKIISTQDFCFVVIDEAHRATGNYSYGFIAQEFNKTNARILALTASPGTSKEQINQVMENLCLEKIVVKKYSDYDVQPYVNQTKIETVEVELDDKLKGIKDLLWSVYNKRISMLKEMEIIDSKQEVITKKDLLDLQMQLRAEIASGDADERVWKGISLAAGLMKLNYGIELFESQEISGAHSYFYNFFRESGDNSKAAQELTFDIDFRDAFDKIAVLKNDNVLHPKLIKLKDLIVKEMVKNKDLRIIVFSQYRESGLKIVSELSQIKELKPVFFVGQAKKSGEGMSQKKQKEILDHFRNGEYNILVSTSVGEEGLDIPKVDLVIFYEPVASAIRTIQRVGRTGRFKEGKAYILQTQGTRDIITKHIATAKEKKMYRVLDEITNGDQKFKSSKAQKNEIGLDKFIKDKKSFENSILIASIFIDNRENNDLIKELYKIEDIEVKSQNLNVGDIVITDQIAIERKSKLDFVNSILDKKIFRQIKDLAINYRRPILILEGSENIYSLRNVNPNVIRASISAIAIDFRVPIIFTDSIKETAQMVATITKRAYKDKKETSLVASKTSSTENEELEKFVSMIPKVNIITSRNILKKFGNIKNLVNASEKEILEVEGVGKLRAKNIKDFFERDWR